MPYLSRRYPQTLAAIVFCRWFNNGDLVSEGDGSEGRINAH